MSNKVRWAAIVIMFCAALFTGCKKNTGTRHTALPQYTLFQDIPGVTFDDIIALEALRKDFDHFVLGMTPGSYAFYSEDGEVRGYAALLCEWMTDLFGIPFKPAIHPLDDLRTTLESGAVHFTGEPEAATENSFSLVYTPVFLSIQNLQLMPVVSIMQKALQNGGIQYVTGLYSRGYEEYRRHSLFLQFTEEERDYLGLRPVVRFVAEHYNYPISFYNVYEKEWQGIAHHILAEVENLTGLTFERVNDQHAEWPAMLKMLTDREGSLITELLYTKAREEHFIWPKTVILTDYYALLSKAEFPNLNSSEVWSTRVGLTRGTAYTDLFNELFPNHANTTVYESSDDAFSALDRGEVDVVMSSQKRLLALTNYHELSGYKANVLFDRSSKSTFGFNRQDAVLCSIFDKALGQIDTRGISEQWVYRTYDYRRKMVQAQRPWLIGSSVLFLCIVVLLFVFFQKKRHDGKRLELLVKERTLELHESQQELKDALVAAENANRSKSSFLANMSHEIRSPMNAILGMTEIQLRKEDIDPDVKTALTKIYSSGDLLLSIINDILDLSKIEAGKMELLPAKYEIASTINDTVMLNLMRIGSKPITFELSVDENTPAMFFGDELRIKQILNNLLSNAFKYTDKGIVKLTILAELDDNDPENATLVISVSDTGQGMSEEQVSKLFDEYSRFNQEANRTTEGTGLGMNIARNLLNMMNGTIAIKSEVGWGTIFTIRLPQKRITSNVLGKELAKNLESFNVNDARQAKKSQVVIEPMPYGKVLVVDDMEFNLDVAKGLMAPYGLTIDLAGGGLQTIEKVENGNVYDIIFMDHMMPKMDGMETTKLLREMGYTHPIVALTANAVVGQADMFLQSGFDAFVSKPIDMRELNAVLKKYVRDRHPAEAAEHQAKPAIEPGRAKLFVRDASKVVAILEDVCKKLASGVLQTHTDEDLELYAINVHKMKGLFTLIGEPELSAVADSLEKAAQDKDIGIISEKTVAFMGDLRAMIEKLTQP